MSRLDDTANLIEKLLDQRIADSEKTIAKKYAIMLDEIRKELGKLFEKYETNRILTYAEMAKYDRLNKFLAYVNSLLSANYKDVKKTIYDVLETVYKEGYYRTAWAIETESLSKLAYVAVPTATIMAMIENPISGLTLSQRLERNRINIIYTIQQEITQGLVKGETYGTMSTRIKTALEGDIVKAMRVTRTEVHRASETAKYESALHAHQNGVLMEKEWMSMEDQRVRPGRGIGKKHARNGANHKFLDDGKKIPVDEDFVGKLGSGPHPGALGHPSEDINCRCKAIYSIEKIEKPDAKELENMTFETWQKERLKVPDGSSDSFKVPQDLSAAAKKIYVKKSNEVRDPQGQPSDKPLYLKQGSYITGVLSIASGDKIKDIYRLIATYTLSNGKQTAVSDWNKMRGTGVVSDGTTEYKVELHWYEAKNIGKIEWKIKKYLE